MIKKAISGPFAPLLVILVAVIYWGVFYALGVLLGCIH